MAANVSTTTANNLLDVLLGAGVNSVSPASVWVGLSTTTPAVDGTGVTEHSGDGYARVEVVNNATNWPAASGRVKSNGTVITFPTATASWNTPTHTVVYSASTAGTLLAFGPITTPTEIVTNAVADYPVGNIDLSI